MAITNHQRVGAAMETLQQGLAPYVEREVMEAAKKGAVSRELVERYADLPHLSDKPIREWDASGLLRIMNDTWNEVFKATLGFSERSQVNELRDWRNKWAHQAAITSDDTDRVLDSVHRLLTAVGATAEASAAEKMKRELRRLIYEEQTRTERRKTTTQLIEGGLSGNAKPWREVVQPHPDVASGRYQQAEFAADLWQVHIGQGTEEYRDPTEFFRRTFLTASLKTLLVDAVRRLTGDGSNPVVQLQTNFGGGKTHSMLALYHLVSGAAISSLPGVDAMLAEKGIQSLPTARRVVLVGNKISPGNPITKPDGTVVKTLWGELAYQLGGKVAFDKIRLDDEHATSPGDRLRELFNEYGPCLILVDEWVAYARQLHDDSDLPGGSFETQFSFAQALTESAKTAQNCLLVVSLPASDTQTAANDVEIGGERGARALDRLRNVVGRIESSWRPATAEEGFEIVRRRLFEPMPEERYKYRDTTAKEFIELYRVHNTDFPADTGTMSYEERIKSAYPIHPEVFDRLYNDWSTLVKFQRTRGVLRLMAAVIHTLWEKGDRNPIILPATIPIDDQRVQFELTRYLSDQWGPIITQDVDGPTSLPLKVDTEFPNLGQYHATRRIARTVFLGSAPLTGSQHAGLDDRHVKLGSVLPGESPAIYNDALRKLANRARYLYQDGSRYWYMTTPTVTKLAEEKAQELERNPEKVIGELERRMRLHFLQTGDFDRVHVFPQSGADVSDEMSCRLVVLSPEYSMTSDAENAAFRQAKEILETRGTSPRLFRNSLIFLSPDRTRLQDLFAGIRSYLAWSSIVEQADMHNLTPQQVTQAQNQKSLADSTANNRIPETFIWVIHPHQSNSQAPVELQRIRASGCDAIASRVSRKLKSDEILLGLLSGSILRMRMDQIPLWRGNHVSVKQLVDDFARYTYLPRLTKPEVLVRSIEDGLTAPNWAKDTFAIADLHDEATNRYAGLRGGASVTLTADSMMLLVKPDVAAIQLESERQSVKSQVPDGTPMPSPSGTGPLVPPTLTGGPVGTSLRRYFGTAKLDPIRMGRQITQLKDEIIDLLERQPGARVTVRLEVDVLFDTPPGDQAVRAVKENARTLGMESSEFE